MECCLLMNHDYALPLITCIATSCLA
jgi:hypothetical protein